MKSRVLPIINTAGCLVLTGVLLAQWTKERDLDKTVAKLNSELVGSRKQAALQAERSAGLERDIAALKESIEATQKAADESARILAEKEAQASDSQAQAATAAQEQVKTWQQAIAERDTKLRTLSADLAAARSRLDSAIAKLKAAGAQ